MPHQAPLQKRVLDHLWLAARLWGIITFVAAVVLFLIGSSPYNAMYVVKFRDVQTLSPKVYFPVGLLPSDSVWLVNAQNVVVSPDSNPVTIYCGDVTGLNTAILKPSTAKMDLPGGCHGLTLAKVIHAWQVVNIGRNLRGSFHRTTLAESAYPATELGVLIQSLALLLTFHGFWILSLTYFYAGIFKESLEENVGRPVTVNLAFLAIAICSLPIAVLLLFSGPSIFVGVLLSSFWLAMTGGVVFFLRFLLIGYDIRNRKCICEIVLRPGSVPAADGYEERNEVDYLVFSGFFFLPLVIATAALMNWLLGMILWVAIAFATARMLPPWTFKVWSLLFLPNPAIM